jgi:predicted dehydrogenase
LIRIGVIGAGYWGEKLIGEYLALSSRNPDVKICGVADMSPQRLYYVKDKYNLPDKILFRNHSEVLSSDKGIDAVHIATPNESHYEIAIEAVERGKHILLEKPMTVSSRSAFKLAREAEKAGKVLLIGHIFRFNNAINEAKRVIESGGLGDVHYLCLKWTTYMKELPERDIIFDLAPHPVDIVNHLLEEWPTSVYSIARSFKRGKPGLEDTAFVTMNLPGDTVAEINLSWIQPGVKTREVVIVGEKSTLYVDALDQRMRLCKNEGEHFNIELEANNTIGSMISHFIDRIVNGSPPVNSPLIGAMTVHVLEKMRESVEKKTSVNVLATP